MMLEEIKDCPFCGAKMFIQKIKGNISGVRFYLSCSVGECIRFNESFKTRADAIKAANMRKESKK